MPLFQSSRAIDAVPKCDNLLHPNKGTCHAALPIYAVADDGHISRPPHVIECTDEKEAIGKAAAQAADGKVVELWDGKRLIVRLPKDET